MSVLYSECSVCQCYIVSALCMSVLDMSECTMYVSLYMSECTMYVSLYMSDCSMYVSAIQ